MAKKKKEETVLQIYRRLFKYGRRRSRRHPKDMRPVLMKNLSLHLTYDFLDGEPWPDEEDVEFMIP